jgi:hypothetical protein
MRLQQRAFRTALQSSLIRPRLQEIPTGQGHHHFCALCDRDVKTLQAKPIRVPAPGEYEFLEDTCSVFTVPVHPKQRVRVITCTRKC